MKQYLLLGLMGICICFQLFSLVYPRIAVATFNEDKVTALFIKQLSARNLSDDAIRQKTILFASYLKQSLNAYAQKKHLLIVKKEQILAGEHDITNEIIKLMAKKANHG